MSWNPTATIESLSKRAKIISQIRKFFAEKNVLEVDTPLLSRSTVTDPHILSIPAIFQQHGSQQTQSVYLQTSPEYAMKRLLAAGSGSIYQICKSFRQGDLGRYHNPEFTMLEWYRVGFDHHDLMKEMDELLQLILNSAPAERLSYGEAFEKYADINPHTATISALSAIVAARCNVPSAMLAGAHDRNFYLDLISSHCIEPQIGQDRPVFLYDFPVSQAALAKIRYKENPPVASRFEVYFKGIELANGFHELQNAAEQRKRFEENLAYRKSHDIASVPIDENFLAALESGLPDCSGVALGVDRLIMLSLQLASIKDSVSFSFENA